MRGDGGLVAADGYTLRLEREGGVSAFFPDPKFSPVVRNVLQNDWWDNSVWNATGPAQKNSPNEEVAEVSRLSETATPGGKFATIGQLQNDPNTQGLVYAVTRGLCAIPGPHQKFEDEYSGWFEYNKPTLQCPDKILASLADSSPPSVARPTDPDLSQQLVRDQTVGDVHFFYDMPTTTPQRETHAYCKWAPVKRGLDNGVPCWGIDASPKNCAVADAVVYESMVEFFGDQALEKTRADDKDGGYFFLACAAASKIAQLKSITTVSFNRGNIRSLCNANPVNGDGTKSFFVTRGVMRCVNLSDTPLLYPCDAGLCSFRITPLDNLVPTSLRADDTIDANLAFLKTYGAEAVGGRKLVDRARCTRHLKVCLSRRDNETFDETMEHIEDGDRVVPLYIAPPPMHRHYSPKGHFVEKGNVRPFKGNEFPQSRKTARSLENIPFGLKSGLDSIRRLSDATSGREWIQKLINGNGNPPEPDDSASRKRRKAVWDDAKREACIAGDRLYAFVRQLSGNIGEQVDAVCQIDEGQLIRQQQELGAQRRRASERAAQEHMTLVRGVMSEVLKESGLTLGIQNDGEIGKLKVVSNTLRKQLSELTQRGSRGDGFFSNAVQLEQLLAQGTGEMDLEELFEKLQTAGLELQKAALSAEAPSAAQSASLEFLSAPRNSLLVRYKPEALAAMRRAFDLFQSEIARHGGHGRKVTAYELIEGRDEALCSEFAAFCGHMLVHSRMFSTSNAMYISAWPASSNVTMLRISLQRLIDAACTYLNHTQEPNFLEKGGRATYFKTAPKMHEPVHVEISLAMAMQRRGGQAWSIGYLQ